MKDGKNYRYEHGVWQGKPAILKLKQWQGREIIIRAYVLAYDRRRSPELPSTSNPKEQTQYAAEDTGIRSQNRND